MVAWLVKNPPAMQETRFDSWVRKIPWRRDRQPTPGFLASLVARLVKNLPAMREAWVRFLDWERSPGEGKGYPLQYLWRWRIPWTVVHRIAKSQLRLSDFHSTFCHFLSSLLLLPLVVLMFEVLSEALQDMPFFYSTNVPRRPATSPAHQRRGPGAWVALGRSVPL